MPALRMRALVPLVVLLVPLSAACDIGGPYRGGDWGTTGYGATGGAASAGATDLGTATCEEAAFAALSSSSSSTAAELGSPGDRCEAASDCAPVCCSCGGPEWLAASCIDGACAAPEIACSRTGTCGEGVWIDEPGAPGSPAACGDLTYGDDACDACMTTSCCASMTACANDASCMGPDACIADCFGDEACELACEEASAQSSLASSLDACRVTFCADVCR